MVGLFDNGWPLTLNMTLADLPSTIYFLAVPGIAPVNPPNGTFTLNLSSGQLEGGNPGGGEVYFTTALYESLVPIENYFIGNTGAIADGASSGLMYLSAFVRGAGFRSCPTFAPTPVPIGGYTGNYYFTGDITVSAQIIVSSCQDEFVEVPLYAIPIFFYISPSLPPGIYAVLAPLQAEGIPDTFSNGLCGKQAVGICNPFTAFQNLLYAVRSNGIFGYFQFGPGADLPNSPTPVSSGTATLAAGDTFTGWDASGTNYAFAYVGNAVTGAQIQAAACEDVLPTPGGTTVTTQCSAINTCLYFNSGGTRACKLGDPRPPLKYTLNQSGPCSWSSAGTDNQNIYVATITYDNASQSYVLTITENGTAVWCGQNSTLLPAAIYTASCGQAGPCSGVTCCANQSYPGSFNVNACPGTGFAPSPSGNPPICNPSATCGDVATLGVTLDGEVAGCIGVSSFTVSQTASCEDPFPEWLGHATNGDGNDCVCIITFEEGQFYISASNNVTGAVWAGCGSGSDVTGTYIYQGVYGCEVTSTTTVTVSG